MTSCSAAFADPADDYRTNDGRGVTWAPADQVYGPGAGTTTPPPSPRPPSPTPTRRRRGRRSATARARRRRRRARRSPSPPHSPARRSSASSTPARSPPARARRTTRPGRRGAHVQRPRHRPGGQHRRHARHADMDDHAGRPTPPDTTITSARPRRRSRRAPVRVHRERARARRSSASSTPALRDVLGPRSTAAAQGAHTFSVRASDAAGRRRHAGHADVDDRAGRGSGEPPPPADAPPTAALNARMPAPTSERRCCSRRPWPTTAHRPRGVLARRRAPGPGRRAAVKEHESARDRLDDWTHTISLRVFDSAGQAVPTALRLRVVRYGGTSEVRRGAHPVQPPFGDGLTRWARPRPRGGVW